MSWPTRFLNFLRGQRLDREIDAELASHLEEAAERGRTPGEALRSFGSPLRHREASRDIRLIPWLDSLRADIVFGWRQLAKHKSTSMAAILSLALAIGACTSAFRLIDAVLLRPLPVSHPEQLYCLARVGLGPEGKFLSFDGWAYPSFKLMRAAVRGQAELIAISHAERADLTFGTDAEMEKPYVQYVSGWMFGSFGLRPALGRLFTESDDLQPGAHPYAVLSYDYWTRRFGRDPKVIGRTFLLGRDLFEVIGVSEERFTGIEPGAIPDVFVPTMMNPLVTRSDATWVRSIARVRPGVALEPVREKLHATSRAFELDRARAFTNIPKKSLERMMVQKVILEPAAAGVSGMQQSLRLPLSVLGVLVALVLLIACANIANLMTARAAARAREMALRVSIGAGRLRLVQLVLAESSLLALLAACAGGVFAWWSAPFVVARLNPPDNPARLSLPADWRVIAFELALTLIVIVLFGLAPALRASAVRPASAIRGGDNPHARRRLMHSLIAAQVAFCALVILVAGLFAATFDRLSHQSPGFSTDRILVLDTVAARPQDPVYWDQAAQHLRSLHGVEAVSLSDSALMNGNSRNNFLSINGGPTTEALTYFRYISPGWLDLMQIPLLKGRDFRTSDTAPGEAIVNETFAKTFLGGANPVGSWFQRGDRTQRYQIVGMVHDSTYRSLREAILPMAYVPVHELDARGAFRPLRENAFLVRTASANPLAMASLLRNEVARAHAGFRVSDIETQEELVLRQTVQERLLALLALFFAAVALLLAAIGMYGVLDYSVLQRRREIGIRMAIGARAGDIARRVTAGIFAVVLAGALAGIALGLVSVRYIQSLFYQVKATDPLALALPAIAVFSAAIAAAIPGILRAVRIDPATSLRSE